MGSVIGSTICVAMSLFNLLRKKDLPKNNSELLPKKNVDICGAPKKMRPLRHATPPTLTSWEHRTVGAPATHELCKRTSEHRLSGDIPSGGIRENPGCCFGEIKTINENRESKK